MRPPRRIALIGLGTTGATALRSLLSGGHSHFSVADAGPPAAERLRDEHPDANIRVYPGPESGLTWFVDWLAGCDLCLLAADAVTARVLWRVNAACLDRRVPLLPGLVMGNVGQIGPLVVAGEGPCLGCLDVRVRAATRRSPFPPPVVPDRTVAEHVGRTLAEEVGRLSLLGRVEYHWSGGGASEHPLARVPGCTECGGLAPHLPFRSPRPFELDDAPRSDPARILPLAHDLVDAVTGPIKSLTRFEPGPRDPAIQHWIAQLADPAWASFGHETLFCGGNALTSDAARAAALGESVERSSTLHVSFDDLLIARHRDIAHEALDPRLWDLFDPRTRERPGFPYAAASPDIEMSWVWGNALVGRRSVRVPASVVFSPFNAVAPGDRFTLPIISGYAAGTTIEDAIYGGLMEVIERDAFMIAWANQLTLPRLEIDGASPGDAGAYFAAFADRGIDVRCVVADLGLGARAVIAIARDGRDGEPTSVIAAAADVDVTAACRRALKELSANRLNVRHEMTKTAGALPEPDPETVIDERLHGLLYARPEMAKSLDIWWSSPHSVPLSPPAPEESVTARIRRCVDVIAGAGQEAVVVELTAPAMARLGLHVVKVLIPGAYPMNFDGRFPQFGGTRMTAAPVAAGLRATPAAFEELCTVPHPFP